MVEQHVWAVVLAAGNGSRVSALTSSPTGVHVPKQYCSFGRPTPMVRWALERASALVPRERVLVVVAREHEPFWKARLSDLPPENLVVQPANRGTAPGILLPLLEVLLRRDAGARLLILPSDHYVAQEPVLGAALRTAIGLRGREDRVVLLGMSDTGFDPEYGWVLPAAATGGPVRDVESFVEKPDRRTADRLVAAGALLNTLILVAEGSTLLRVYEETLPELVSPFRSVLRACDAGALAALYESLPTQDFSRDVLERSPRRLALLRVPACGWSDLGTPARLQMFQRAVRSATLPRPSAAATARRSAFAGPPRATADSGT
jgi:mannose-1-phosphate guanylyltransferase